jgi:hypothetical protein
MRSHQLERCCEACVASADDDGVVHWFNRCTSAARHSCPLGYELSPIGCQSDLYAAARVVGERRSYTWSCIEMLVMFVLACFLFGRYALLAVGVSPKQSA